ncbi:MAG TPA: SpoIIE family protein phosphatase [Candidatus Baltobacteraceae bacterium]|nr:SpoIIE family protein phosphatase [Candidatus Baltobacteraceae bacterium]
MTDVGAFADALPQLVWIVESDRLAFVNRAWREYVGVAVGAAATDLLDFVHPDDREALRTALREGVTERELRIRRAADGSYRWHLMRWQYVTGSLDLPICRVGTAVDVHDRHRAAEEQAFLAEASRTINVSLDLEQTLRAVARRAVPRLAEWCEIDIPGREGVVTRALAHWDEPHDQRLRALVGRVHDANPTAQYERVEAALRGGRSVITRAILDELLDQVVNDVRAREIYRAVGIASSALVPLISRDRVLGWIAFMRSHESPPYADDDLPLLEEFASRAALAIDNARIFGREHRVADAMQSASLPRKLPKLPTIDMHAIYVPGENEAQIGGDWYDAFRLRDGRLVISVGDVIGSGVDAAVTMGNMRQIIRGTAQLHADPVLMLDAADSALRLEDGERYVTACVAVLDPVSQTMTYAGAGHPPPYARDATDGSLKALPCEGLPLGLRQRISGASPATVQLAPGSVLVFYTDGLIESTHDVIDGIASLEGLLASNQFYTAANPAKFVRSQMLENGARDDVAILVVRLRGAEASDSTRRIYYWKYETIDHGVMRKLRERLEHVLGEHGLETDAIERAKLVLGELVGNVARHAPGALQIIVDLTSAAPVLHVVDEGTGFEREPSLPADLLSESGRGLFIVSELTQEFTIARGPAGGSHARAVLDT